jgi:hypothetical protein
MSPKFLESKLKKEYGANSKVPYMVMNKIGAMHGNKETKKGKNMEKKHDAKKTTLPVKGDKPKPLYTGKGTRARLNTYAKKAGF